MDSPSALDSVMEDTGAKRRSGETNNKNNLWFNRDASDGGDSDEDNDAAHNTEAWQTLSKNFREAQSVLDQNRALIQQVNENHQSKIPDNLVKNVALIREINGNISKVSSLYSNLSVNFVNVVNQGRERDPPSNNNKISKSNDKVESM